MLPILALALLLLVPGGALADTTVDQESTTLTEFSQWIRIPEDNVLATLALDAQVRLDDIAESDRRLVAERTASREVDLDEEDALLSLALADDGRSVLIMPKGTGWEGFGPIFFGDVGSWGDFDVDQARDREVRQRVDVNETNVLMVLALGDHLVDYDGITDIADIERTTRASDSGSASVELDEDTVLLALAARR